MIEQKLSDLKNQRMAHYTLTKFLILDVIAHILRSGTATDAAISSKASLRDKATRSKLLKVLPKLIDVTVSNLDYEVGQEPATFDYKAAFKSPDKVKSIRDRILLTHQKDVKRGKAPTLNKL